MVVAFSAVIRQRLTGYQLQDLASEVSMRLDDPRLADLAAATEGLSAVVSFVEESEFVRYRDDPRFRALATPRPTLQRKPE